MQLPSTGLVYIGLRVTDLARARHFYVDTLGFEPLLELPDLLICNTYGSTIAFRGNATQTHVDDRFDPYRVGLDHVAPGVASAHELEATKRPRGCAQQRSRARNNDAGQLHQLF